MNCENVITSGSMVQHGVGSSIQSKSDEVPEDGCVHNEDLMTNDTPIGCHATY